MKRRLVALLILGATLLGLCGCQGNIDRSSEYTSAAVIDKDSYTEMVERLVNYSLYTMRGRAIIKEAYSDYITEDALEKMMGIKNFKVLGYDEDLSTMMTLYEEGSVGESDYPIYDENGTETGMTGTYKEHKDSIDMFNSRPMNRITRFEVYDTMLIANIVNKYNGLTILRCKFDDTGKIYDIALFR